MVYGIRGRFEQKDHSNAGVMYRGVRIAVDRRLNRFLSVLSRRPNDRRPIFASDLYFIGYAFNIARDLRRQQCDIVHIYNFPQFVPIIKAFNPRIRVVLNMHGEWLTQLKWRAIDKKLDLVDSIVGCSEFVTEKIRLHFPKVAKRCRSIYMGVDPDHFCVNEVSSHRTNGTKRLLFVGRVSPEKGLHVLLEALEKVVVRHPRTYLEIVGPEWALPKGYLVDLSDDTKLSDLKSFYNGNYRSYLQSRLSAHLGSHVTFCGLVPHGEVVNYYHNSDVFINPSFYESLGMSTIEAMACGIPVVTTPVGGVPEVIEDGKSGSLVEPGDPDELARAIGRLLEDESLRLSMGQAARKRAVKLFSWELICEKLSCLYRNILERQS